MNKVFVSVLASVCIMTSSLFADMVQNQIVSTSAYIMKAFAQDYNKTKYSEILPKRFAKKNIKAIIIIPDMIKTGLIATVQVGSGVFCMRDDEGEWQDPLFVTIKGAGIGLQGGYLSNDAVILFSNRRSYSALFSEDKTLGYGVDGSIIGGRSKSKMTDLPALGADMLALGRSDGIFGGISLGSSLIKVDDQNNIDYYNRMYQDVDIANGSPKDSKHTKKLKKILTEIFNK